MELSKNKEQLIHKQTRLDYCEKRILELEHKDEINTKLLNNLSSEDDKIKELQKLKYFIQI